jgi:DNA-nicking Smr family endonuclease
MAKKSKKELSHQDETLWEEVKKKVKPLKRTATPMPLLGDGVKPRLKAAITTEKITMPQIEEKIKSSKTTNIRSTLALPPLATLASKEKRKIAKGQTDIEAKLDLHGLTQDEARHRLLNFLKKSQGQGHKLALIITGKGRTGTGILKRMVPEWLKEPNFRKFVIGFQHAHIVHGGDGALYIRIRRMERRL